MIQPPNSFANCKSQFTHWRDFAARLLPQELDWPDRLNCGLWLKHTEEIHKMVTIDHVEKLENESKK